MASKRNSNGVVDGRKAAAGSSVRHASSLRQMRSPQAELALKQIDHFDKNDVVARKAFVLVIDSFLTAEAKETSKGRVPTTQVAANNARQRNAGFFYKKENRADAKRGADAAVEALYAAGRAQAPKAAPKLSKAAIAISAMPKPTALVAVS